MEFDEYKAMNTTIQVAAEGSWDKLAAGFQQVRRFTAECEARFSRFRDESELCQLNRSAGTWFQASDGMFELMKDALDLYRLTDGLFDPSILDALRQIGYDRSMDEFNGYSRPRIPATTQPAASRFGQTLLDAINKAIYLPEGVQVDFGGIAKGWIAEKTVHILAKYSQACAVSIGGDMALQGIPAGEAAWLVSLEDPRDEQAVLAVLGVASGSIATSSVTRRRWMQGNQVRHHIIDPRTGTSAQVKWLSVTVGAPAATTAEALAKAILIGGRKVGLQLAEEIPGLWFIAVNPNGSLTGTENSKEIVYESFQLQPST